MRRQARRVIPDLSMQRSLPTWARNAVVVLCALLFWWTLVWLRVPARFAWPACLPLLPVIMAYVAGMFELVRASILVRALLTAAIPTAPLAAEWFQIPIGNPRFVYFEAAALNTTAIYAYLLTSVVSLFKFAAWLQRRQRQN